MKTLRAKILTCFIVSTTITLSLLLYLVNRQVQDINIPLTQNLSQQIIDAKAEEIGAWLEERISELRVISINEDFINMDMDKAKPYIRNLNKRLSNEYGNESETFAFSDLDGNAWISDDTTIHIKNREYFVKAINSDKEFVVSNPIISKTDSAPIVIVIYPIRNADGKVVGTIHGAINLSKLSQISSNIKMHGSNAWITDSRGNIFTDVPKDNVKDMSDFDTLISENTGKINIFKMSKYGYKGFESVGKKMLNGQSGIDKIIKPDGKGGIVIYSPIPYSDGWSLGITIPEEKMYADTNRLIHLIIIFSIILLLVSILISLIFTSSIVKPVRKLQMLMKRVENGDLNIHYDGKGHDEIAQLGYSFNSMVDKIRNLIDKVYLQQKEKRKAELKVLESQINPHFLYNTLDTIQWKAIEHDAYDAADMITALSNLFRISLSKGKEIITFGEEIEHVKSYLFIQQERFKDKLKYSINYDESLNNFKVLKLIIQPIVENAINHGIKTKRENGFINISIEKKENDIYIYVKDNGMGIEEGRLKLIKSCLKKGGTEYEDIGYGIFNVNERIQLQFGKNYGVDIDSIYGFGTKATIKIPVIKEGDLLC
jgi:two-component system sensor histidine kinase YesM